MVNGPNANGNRVPPRRRGLMMVNGGLVAVASGGLKVDTSPLGVVGLGLERGGLKESPWSWLGPGGFNPSLGLEVVGLELMALGPSLEAVDLEASLDPSLAPPLGLPPSLGPIVLNPSPTSSLDPSLAPTIINPSLGSCLGPSLAPSP